MAWRKQPLKPSWINWTYSFAEFGKVVQFGWCDIGKIRADAGPQFTSEEFKDGCAVRGVNLTIATPEHQEMNNIAESNWKNIHTIAHSQMNFGRVEEKFNHVALINAAHVSCHHACAAFKGFDERER